MNCKPGDLAIVISAKPFYIETLGRIVVVIEPSIYSGEWVIEFVGNRPKCIMPDSYVSCGDNSLRPVSGLPMQDEVIEKLKEPA